MFLVVSTVVVVVVVAHTEKYNMERETVESFGTRNQNWGWLQSSSIKTNFQTCTHIHTSHRCSHTNTHELRVTHIQPWCKIKIEYFPVFHSSPSLPHTLNSLPLPKLFVHRSEIPVSIYNMANAVRFGFVIVITSRRYYISPHHTYNGSHPYTRPVCSLAYTT